MSEKEDKKITGNQCHTANAGQTGNKTAEHVKVARDIYNEAKKSENKK